MEGLAVLNIPSMHGGSNLWGESKKLDGVPKVENSEVITDPEHLKTISQGKKWLRLRGVFLVPEALRLPALSDNRLVWT